MLNLLLRVYFYLFLLTSSWSVQANYCHDHFSYRSTYQNTLNPIAIDINARMAAIEASALPGNLWKQFVADFSKSYDIALGKVDSVAELFALYRQVNLAFDNPTAIKFRHTTNMEPIQFSQGHAKLLIRLKERMTEAQIQEFFDILFEPSILKIKDNEISHAWWRRVWVAKLILEPEATLVELRLLMKSEFRGAHIQDPRMREALIAPLTYHTPDVVEAFLSLPKNLRLRTFENWIHDIYPVGSGKRPNALRISRKLDHDSLRQLNADISQTHARGKLTELKVIELIDEHWQRTGILQGILTSSLIKRGGYSFSKVLDLARAYQTEIANYSGVIRPTAYIFGSFVNGLAHFQRLENGKYETYSDVDVTFKNNSQYANQNLKGSGWRRKAWEAENSNNPRFQLLDRMDGATNASLNLRDGHGPILAPSTGASKFLLIAKKGSYSVPELSLASPISIEIRPRKIILNIYLLKDGALQAESFSYPINSGRSRFPWLQ